MYTLYTACFKPWWSIFPTKTFEVYSEIASYTFSQINAIRSFFDSNFTKHNSWTVFNDIKCTVYINIAFAFALHTTAFYLEILKTKTKNSRNKHPYVWGPLSILIITSCISSVLFMKKSVCVCAQSFSSVCQLKCWVSEKRLYLLFCFFYQRTFFSAPFIHYGAVLSILSFFLLLSVVDSKKKAKFRSQRQHLVTTDNNVQTNVTCL